MGDLRMLRDWNQKISHENKREKVLRSLEIRLVFYRVIITFTCMGDKIQIVTGGGICINMLMLASLRGAKRCARFLPRRTN